MFGELGNSTMVAASGNELATAVLSRLSKHYMMDSIEEVAINRPGFVWRKMRGGKWEEFEAPELTYDYCKQVCVVLSNINSQRFSETDLPVVSCELPGAPFRFQAIMGPNVRYNLDDRRGAGFAIRSLKANTEITFARYGLTQGATIGRAREAWFNFELSEDLVEQIAQAVANYQSIIVSGATSTGKTTFVNQVIRLIDPDRRVISVEDTREVTIPHKNRLHLMVPRNRGTNSIGYSEILDSIVRLTPEFVVCGELSVQNAQPLFSLMGKGHPIITTVHASSPEDAMKAFINNMSSAGAVSGMSGDAMMDSLEALTGCIVQLVNHNDVRKVTEIVFPSRDRHFRLEVEQAKKRPAPLSVIPELD